MAYLFLLILIGSLYYFIKEEKVGVILCLLTLFPEIVGVILNKAGFTGLNMAVKYVLFAVCLWECRKLINSNLSNLWRNPISVLFYILIGVMIWHNNYYVRGAIFNPDIATFQLNVILRVFIPYVIIMLCADHDDVIEQYCNSIPWWGLGFIIVFVSLMGFGAVDMSDRMTLEKETGVNSIMLSRIAAMTILGALIPFLRESNKVLKYSYLVIMIIGAFMLLLASQRGTIIGVGVAVVIALALILLREGKHKQFWIITCCLGISIFVLLNYFDFEILHRFQQLEEYQTFERYADYGIAWRAFSENDYLTGLGSMGYNKYTGGFRPYPHSMVLELMAEYGIVGLITAMTIIVLGSWMAYKILMRTENATAEMSVPIIWISLLSSVLVSGSFLSNAPFFLLTAILILCYQNNSAEDSEEDIEAYEDRL